MIADSAAFLSGRAIRSMRAHGRADEGRRVRALLAGGRFDAEARARIARLARRLVRAIRQRRARVGGVETFLHEYGLSNHEGVALMCLAEALLRIPDGDTADRLIQEKVGGQDWERHLGKSESLLVNASTWGLMLTGGIVRLGAGRRDVFSILGRVVARSGEPFIREAVRAAMRIIGGQFVMGETIEDALARAGHDPASRYSFDMLGEAAMTADDAGRYFDRYAEAIAKVGAFAPSDEGDERNSVSIKLSALHPRFEMARGPAVIAELGDRLAMLARRARDAGIALTIDSEEAHRLEPTLAVFARLWAEKDLAEWDGLGIAVQAYLKRAPFVIDWLVAQARHGRRPIAVRLVKGAYWDSEIKLAQEAGLDGYPVFTRKSATDLSYLACARALFAAADAIRPQFATHNAHTVAAVIELAREAGVAKGGFEFQRLHGMGEALYGFMAEAAPRAVHGGHPVRVYAPVGSHETLLPYLVRRLLENGANSSFVNRMADDRAPLDRLIGDPAERLAALARNGEPIAHRRIPLPGDLFAPERRNSAGLDLTDPRDLAPLAEQVTEAAARSHRAAPRIGGRESAGTARAIRDPADLARIVGEVVEAGSDEVEAALASTAAGAAAWGAVPAEERARILDDAADRIEADRAALMALAIREAGKSVRDALAEVREAVDLTRYYAARARAEFAAPRTLPGVTGEDNSLAFAARGVFACISPWNFPLAIFAGQVTAALAAGNAVIAKPAEQTPLIGARAIDHLLAAGVPGNALAFLPGGGEAVGAPLVSDGRVDGVAFTGSTETAHAIARALAARDGPIVPLIAETGGQNGMIVDSSALPEQVVRDVITSAFLSAGQRCSALRVLALQADIADTVLDMLSGAMAELTIGDPGWLATDIGPIIDGDARAMLAAHEAGLAASARLIARVPMPAGLPEGHWFAPSAWEIGLGGIPPREVFGPILHVLRWENAHLDDVLDGLAATGYGLTLGIHSRIEATQRRIRARLPVGNTYVNRSMIGAVVGSQPFGGEGLSGTGPKAGGPHYLHRFAVERTVSVNTAAAGGNAALFASLDEEDRS